MKKLVLTQSVTIRGLDYWGRESWITFTPTTEAGWWWDTGNDIVKIDLTIAKVLKRRIVLSYKKERFNVWEHCGPIRWKGVDGVLVSCKRFDSFGIYYGCWPPYDGATAQFWQALKGFVATVDETIPWEQIPKSVMWHYPENHQRYVKLTVREKPGLKVFNYTNWRGVGAHEHELIVENNLCEIEQYFQVKSQGWPLIMYRPSRVFENVPYLPRPSCMTWSQAVGNQAARLYNHHRMLDILGGLSLWSHSALPQVDVVNYCGGHLADIKALELAKS